MGSVSTTVSGRECQAWAATTPHVPGDTITDDKFPDGSRAAANNYCRNPNGYGRGP